MKKAFAKAVHYGTAVDGVCSRAGSSDMAKKNVVNLVDFYASLPPPFFVN